MAHPNVWRNSEMKSEISSPVMGFLRGSVVLVESSSALVDYPQMRPANPSKRHSGRSTLG